MPGRMRLTSSAFAEGQTIPVECTCDGADLSPGLTWESAPPETQCYALICEDPDAPRGTWVHWLLYNLTKDAVELQPGMAAEPELKSGARQGMNDFKKLGYGGPCPPPGPAHRYFFRLFALDTQLSLPAGATRAELDAAARGHIIAEGELMGTYERKPR